MTKVNTYAIIYIVLIYLKHISVNYKKELIIALLSQLKWNWEFSEILIEEIKKWNIWDLELENLSLLLLNSAKNVDLENKTIERLLIFETIKSLEKQESLDSKENITLNFI